MDKVPALIVVYGSVKSGKTSDTCYSFPTAIFVAQPGALKPADGIVGYMPKSVDLPTIQDATKLLKEAAALSNGKKPVAIVVDDFSLLAERTVALLERKYASSSNKYAVWDAVRDVLLDFRDTARHSGLHVVLTCHEIGPRMQTGAFVQGGPRLPGRMVSDLPAACDTVLRVGVDEMRRGPWPGVYRCTPLDPNYVSGDRHGVVYDKCPMNLGELLRAAGYSLPRAPGMEWTEEFVGKLADFLGDPVQEQAVLREAVEALRVKPGTTDLQIRWVLRDALDRVAIRRHRRNPLAAFGV